MNKDNKLRKLLVHIWRTVRASQYKKHHVFVTNKVSFNPQTRFGEYCKVGRGSVVNDSTMGSYSYINHDSDLANCEIGKFCSIASGVQVISSTHPSHTFVSTSPVFYSLQKQCGTTFVNSLKFNEIMLAGGVK